LGITHTTILLLAACLIFSCKGGDDNIVDPRPQNSAGVCDLKIEDFVLSNEDTNLLAYDTFDKVTFKNEEGETLVFSVNDPVESIFEGIFGANDSLDICYATEYSETKLTSSEGIEITFLTEPKAYFADLESALFADVMKVYYNNINDMGNDRRIVFRKVIDLNSYPPPLYETTTTIGSQYFIDKEFKNIEYTKFNSPIIELYFNDMIGVVAFIDELGVLWQFQSKS